MSTFKAIRDRLDVTQAALAKAIGCTQGNVSFYEKGQTVPPEVARLLIAYAKTLGHHITFNDIYGEPGAPLTPEIKALSDQALADAFEPVLVIKPTPKKGV